MQQAMETLSTLVAPYTGYLPWLGWASLISFLVSLALVPVLLARIPADYFTQTKARARKSAPKNSRLHYSLVWILRNLTGLVLVLAGVAMLILPGQGLLTIILGVFVADFPGKWTLERKLVTNQNVFNAINWIRNKRGVEHLVFPEQSTEIGTDN